MNLRSIIALAVVVATGASTNAQISLSDFSNTTGPMTYFFGTWEATGSLDGTTNPNPQFFQGSDFYSINGAGVTNADTSFMEIYFDTPMNLTGNSFIGVRAEVLELNAAPSFKVYLRDTGGNVAFAGFEASSFLVGTFSKQVVELTTVGAFSLAAVESIFITGDIPGGTARFNFSFDSIVAQSAIPEPSTYVAIIGAMALGFVAYRRRQALAA